MLELLLALGLIFFALQMVSHCIADNDDDDDNDYPGGIVRW